MKARTGFFQTRQRAFIGVMLCLVGTALVPASNLHFEPYIFHGIVAGFLCGIGALIIFQELRKEFDAKQSVEKDDYE